MSFPQLTMKLVMRRRLACKPAHLCYPKGDAAISWHVMASWFWPNVWPHGSQRAAAWIYVNTCVARTCWRWVRKGLYSRSYSARQRSTASKNPEMPSPVAADTPTVCSPRTITSAYCRAAVLLSWGGGDLEYCGTTFCGVLLNCERG